MPSSDILVHISAPTGKQDDERFRKLAKAYSAFESSTKLSLRTARINENTSLSKRCGTVSRTPQNKFLKLRNRKNTEFDPGVQVSISSFPAPRHESRLHSSPWSRGSSPSLARETYIEDSQLAAAALESQLWTSSLGDPNRSTRRRNWRKARAREELQSYAASYSGVAIPRDPVEQKNVLVGSDNDLYEDAPSFPIAHNVTEPNSNIERETRSDDQCLKSVVSIIFGPDAPVAHDDYDAYSHITAELAQVASRFSLEDRFYRHAMFLRELDPKERGYWRFELSSSSSCSWDLQSREKFWNSLETYVENGNAGWGLTFIIERHLAGTAPATSFASSKALSKRPLRDVATDVYRFFCYGETAPHIYALVYATSLGKLKNIPVEWIDLDEKTVVSMHVNQMMYSASKE